MKMKIGAISILSLIFNLALNAKQTTFKEPKLLWKVSDSLKNPESVVFDANTNSYYVSNVNGDGNVKDGNGFISQIDASGKIKKAQWATGLNAPKGLAIQGDSLWVADIDELVEFDLKNGKVLKKLSVNGAQFLNDVAANKDLVFVSDTLGNSIYKYDGKTLSKVTSKENFESPNGLNIQGERLIVASWGEIKGFNDVPKAPGTLYSINFDGSKKSPLSKGFGNLDGLEKSNDSYIVSDWVNGKLYKVNPKGEATVLLQEEQGLADITLKVENGKTIAILPLMVKNQVAAYEID
ncbi:MAG: hypothetical protein R3A80_05935 [Bdellovibrionota bacterium]